MWIGRRLPPMIVLYAIDQLVHFAEETGDEIGFHALMELQSNWMIEKLP